jgi:hypothetical protein
MGVSGQLRAPAALPPGKEPRYPLDRRLGGPQGRSGRGGEETKKWNTRNRNRKAIKWNRWRVSDSFH